MSGDGLRFLSMVTPDVIETAGRTFGSAPPKPRKPRQPKPWSLKKEHHDMTTNNPKPDEIQAGLDAALAKFVDAAPTPEKKAEVLIKIGSYQVELSKYSPMLREADIETARETLAEWFDAGDAELKKCLVNAGSGTEDFPLMKMALAEEGPEYELAKMLEAAETDRAKAALLQKLSFYGTQLHEMLGRGDLLKIAPADIEAAVTEWVEDGDGTHKAMKKALAADAYARRAAATSPGENEAVDEKAGNAATHTAAQMGNPTDKTYAPRGSGAGAGPRKLGTMAAPGQADAPSPTPGSGPNDTGDGGVNPTIKIRRKGTTGGLGSVAGADRGSGESIGDAGVPSKATSDGTGDEQGNKKKKKKMMDKGADLSGELIKLFSDDAIGMLAKMTAEEQVATCETAAQDAADLIAWSVQQDPDKLQKATLDAAITDWLSANLDPAVIAMKKHVSEALATAEEIPIGLAQAIMAWQPAGSTTLRVRQPHRAAA